MRAAAREQLEALDVFRRATTTLGAVLEGLDIPIQARSATVDTQSAILNLCVLALRSARAAGVLIRSGYEAEALGLMRRVHEATARVGAVIADASGQHAREWLEGQAPSTPRRIASKFGNLAFFDMYSESTHASMTGLLQWVAVELPGGRRMMPIAPMREPLIANTMLVGLAVECRDLAMIAGRTFEREVRGLEHLDVELLGATERFVRAAAAASGAEELEKDRL
jgi:hypothetical protein